MQKFTKEKVKVNWIVYADSLIIRKKLIDEWCFSMSEKKHLISAT